jgi:hypothetical protein
MCNVGSTAVFGSGNAILLRRNGVFEIIKQIYGV